MRFGRGGESILRLALACLVTGLALVASAKPLPRKAEGARSCEVEIGARRAGLLLRDCRLVAGICRPEVSCAAWTTEVRRACEAAGADALPACEAYVEIDDDADEDE